MAYLTDRGIPALSSLHGLFDSGAWQAQAVLTVVAWSLRGMVLVVASTLWSGGLGIAMQCIGCLSVVDVVVGIILKS